MNKRLMFYSHIWHLAKTRTALFRDEIVGALKNHYSPSTIDKYLSECITHGILRKGSPPGQYYIVTIHRVIKITHNGDRRYLKAIRQGHSSLREIKQSIITDYIKHILKSMSWKHTQKSKYVNSAQRRWRNLLLGECNQVSLRSIAAATGFSLSTVQRIVNSLQGKHFKIEKNLTRIGRANIAGGLPKEILQMCFISNGFLYKRECNKYFFL